MTSSVVGTPLGAVTVTYDADSVAVSFEPIDATVSRVVTPTAIRAFRTGKVPPVGAEVTMTVNGSAKSFEVGASRVTEDGKVMLMDDTGTWAEWKGSECQ